MTLAWWLHRRRGRMNRARTYIVKCPQCDERIEVWWDVDFSLHPFTYGEPNVNGEKGV